MQRKTFDILTSGGGAIVAVVLVVAGALLLWGHSYSDSNVRNQLAMQQIYFPPKAAILAAKTNTGEIQKRMIPYLAQYGGQQVLTGAQAEAYADHFIAYHLQGMPFGGVYSKASAAAMAAKPGSAAATQDEAVVATIFKGTTLRGMLLEAYGFWKIGQIMLWGAIASFIMAGLLAVFVALGFAHAGKVSEEERVLAGRRLAAKAPQTA